MLLTMLPTTVAMHTVLRPTVCQTDNSADGNLQWKLDTSRASARPAPAAFPVRITKASKCLD